MSESTLQTSPSAAGPAVQAPEVNGTPPQAKAGHSKHPVVRVLETVGSLRVTVTLFVLGLILVFMGTLAQIDAGIWTVVGRYFRSFIVFMPVQLLVQFGQVFFGLPRDMRIPDSVAIPFPGGWTLGTALMLNLFCAYALRIPTYMKHWVNYLICFAVIAVNCLIGYLTVTYFGDWTFLWVALVLLAFNFGVLLPLCRKAVFFPGNRIGILTLHIGLVLMMVGEFITGVWAVEGHMTIEEGQVTSVVEQNRVPELAFIDPSNPETDTVTVVPGSMLKQDGKKISHPELPVDVEIVKYMLNSRLKGIRPGDTDNPATKGDGLEAKAVELGEVSGVDSEQKAEVPSLYAKLTDKKTGADLGTYLLSVWLQGHPQKVTVDGKTYDVALRFKQTIKPYSLELIEFRFDRYPGTQTPKNFSSRVRLHDKEHGDNRELTIRMNEPLRHRGDTFFQADWNKKTEKGTVLQVVRNPAWQLPYWSCAIVSIGMLMHFWLNLITFLGRRATE